VPEASLTPAAAAPPFPLKSRQPREQGLPSSAGHGRSAASDCASFPTCVRSRLLLLSVRLQPVLRSRLLLRSCQRAVGWRAVYYCATRPSKEPHPESLGVGERGWSGGRRAEGSSASRPASRRRSASMRVCGEVESAARHQPEGGVSPGPMRVPSPSRAHPSSRQCEGTPGVGTPGAGIPVAQVGRSRGASAALAWPWRRG
jgi:hypothetical protein